VGGGEGNSLCLIFLHLFHLSFSKNCTILDLLVRCENSMSFSFEFRCNLTNRETIEVASLLFLLEGCSGRRDVCVWNPNPSWVSPVSLCLVCCWILPPLKRRFLIWCGGKRFLRKLGSLSNKSCLVKLILLIGLLGELRLSGLFVACCIRRSRKILILLVGIASLQGPCGAPSCRSSVLALLVCRVSERRSRSSSSIRFSKIKGVFYGL